MELTKKAWPFTYDETALKGMEDQFFQISGVALNSTKHIDTDDKNELLSKALPLRPQLVLALKWNILMRHPF